MRVEPGQVAVITGGASGIGFGLAEVLAGRGVRLVISDVRPDGLASAASSLKEKGADVTALAADVREESAVRAVADAALSAYGQVDLVCNNAGVVCPAASMWDQDPATWRRMIDIKMLGVIHGVRVFAPLLIRRGSGHILNTASSGGLAPLPGRTPYTGTMHAVVGLTETLDLELKEAAPGLGATVLCPGLVDTPLGANSAALGAFTLPPGSNPGEGMRSQAAAQGGILTPVEVAEEALKAIEAGRVHVAPGTGVADRARTRVESLLSDIT
ncbi:MAG: SDR family NAD(P)-dependent oxidoreductase [Streptosporangiales bacterium]|nr:SDR family NAD(P)-dependent oxidoreductase [Streptosporangiales bacterium]